MRRVCAGTLASESRTKAMRMKPVKLLPRTKIALLGSFAARLGGFFLKQKRATSSFLVLAPPLFPTQALPKRSCSKH